VTTLRDVSPAVSDALAFRRWDSRAPRPGTLSARFAWLCGVSSQRCQGDPDHDLALVLGLAAYLPDPPLPLPESCQPTPPPPERSPPG
jgi:hypothetical protein